MSRPTSPCCNVATRAAYSRRGSSATFVPIATAYECPACGIVHQPRNLRELHAWLLANPDAADWTELPTYGGDEPANTHHVWSWDETHLLVGADTDSLGLVSRAEW